jgi:hypothetical protein
VFLINIAEGCIQALANCSFLRIAKKAAATLHAQATMRVIYTGAWRS